jgi:type IV pilus assembly protein PilM
MAFQGKQVSLAASLPIEPGLVVDGVVLDSYTVGQRIRELITAYGITEKQFIVGIGGINSIYRILTLPKLPGRMLDEAIRRQSEKVLPISARDAYISWQVFQRTGEEVLVGLLAVPKANIDSVAETLQSIGIEISIMDVAPMALASVVDDSSALIINAESTGFNQWVSLRCSLRSSKGPYPSLSRAAKDTHIEVNYPYSLAVRPGK